MQSRQCGSACNQGPEYAAAAGSPKGRPSTTDSSTSSSTVAATVSATVHTARRTLGMRTTSRTAPIAAVPGAVRTASARFSRLSSCCPRRAKVSRTESRTDMTAAGWPWPLDGAGNTTTMGSAPNPHACALLSWAALQGLSVPAQQARPAKHRHSRMARRLEPYSASATMYATNRAAGTPRRDGSQPARRSVVTVNGLWACDGYQKKSRIRSCLFPHRTAPRMLEREAQQ
jgi:hypothetical protein